VVICCCCWGPRNVFLCVTVLFTALADPKPAPAIWETYKTCVHTVQATLRFLSAFAKCPPVHSDSGTCSYVSTTSFLLRSLTERPAFMHMRDNLLIWKPALKVFLNLIRFNLRLFDKLLTQQPNIRLRNLTLSHTHTHTHTHTQKTILKQTCRIMAQVVKPSASHDGGPGCVPSQST
jgi:hypothetical protein